MNTAAPSGVAGSQGYAPSPTVDTTGQMAPPGMKPKVTATLWEDEGSLCFQVEAKGVCVARREGKVPLWLLLGLLTGNPLSFLDIANLGNHLYR